ncbi:MAG: ABC transporter substrate-binding protein [Burkholderiales bacterium]|nr:ABC transporter substrate-binding protein [Burkholderiales bacterium]
MRTRAYAASLVLALAAAPAAAQQTVKLFSIVELSGPGTTAGTNFKNGVELAVKEVNAAGGILGRRIATETYDTQTNPQTAKALAQKAVDSEAFAVMGPVFSGSIMVSMAETRRAGVPNFTGGEAAGITLQGNPYVFRTSFSQATGMPKLANYLASGLKVKSVAIVWVNNDFGKGGRDQMTKELAARNIKVAADVSTDQGQVDFAAAVLRAKQANADALFVYLNEDESARILRELRKQGYDRPIVGETTIMGQKVIDLAGEAANGVRGHVGLTIDAPNPAIRAFGAKFEKEYNYKSDHNGIKGYFAVFALKAATEKAGKLDRKAVAQALKNACYKTAEHPGLLMDVCFDDKGDIDRESFLVEVKGGKQVVVETLPPLSKR